MDPQGRLLIPSALRKAMKAENQPVWLEHQKGHIKLFGAEVYEAASSSARSAIARTALAIFEKKGLL